MKNFSLKVLGAFIFAAGLVVAGVVAPAHAATITPTITPTSFVSGATNPTAITITATATVTAANQSIVSVKLPTGWTFVAPGSCASTSTTYLPAGALQCSTSNPSGFAPRLGVMYMNGAVTPQVPFSVTFPANSINVGTGTQFIVELGNMTQSTTVLDQGTIDVTFSGGSAPVSASMTLGASTGQLIAGSTVAVAATGLQTTAPYTVVVQSTPQTIGSGSAVSGAVNTSVTLPSGLEAGWHSLTFSSIASDGSTVTSVTYFKVSASGTLLATSSTIPAELANTGFEALPFLATGGMLALAGVTIMLFARRRYSN